MTLLSSALLFISFLWLTSCGWSGHVKNELAEETSQIPTKRSNQTVVVFLIDGLSVDLLREELGAGHLPQIKAHFLENKSTVIRARTVFPSLTFPAISSLLSGSPINEHGIFGNQIREGIHTLNFESPLFFPQLNERLKNKMIFQRLTDSHLTSVSFDYAFQSGATARLQNLDSESALSIIHDNSKRVDQKTLASVHELLEKSKFRDWPHFIFVHLIGLDLTSHEFGPTSREAKSALALIDEQLKETLKDLRETESLGLRQVTSLLLSDHGYDIPVEQTVDLESQLQMQFRNVFRINEGRYISLYYPPWWKTKDRALLKEQLLKRDEVALLVEFEAEQIILQNSKRTTHLHLSSGPCQHSSVKVRIDHHDQSYCPLDLAPVEDPSWGPHLYENLALFSQTEGRPDLMVISKPGTSYLENYKGLHGGPTSREMEIPLLIRGAQLSSISQQIRIYEILSFLP